MVALALHPAMTFAGRPEDLDRLAGASFGVTAPEPQLRAVAEALVLEMGAEPVWVPEAARALYHAALAIGANYLVTLVNESVELLAGAGVEAPAQLLAPLLSAALDNALRLGDAALTGPIAAGRHRHRRAARADAAARGPRALATYTALARRTAERARHAGQLSAEQASAVAAALEPR